MAEGYSAGKLQLSQTAMEIRGQAEDIDAVSYAKVDLDIGTDATDTVTAELDYQFYDANDQLLDATSIHTTRDRFR